MHECQFLEADVVPLCPKPIGYKRRDGLSDLVFMLLAGQYGSLTTLTEPTIQAWIPFFSPEITAQEISKYLQTYCEVHR